mmetsp:Transcript_44212/g.87211  ORF Transcript_44212/g.87211 Transcript_44212/m.87211 type:complete len:136 (+) Transcript_44212:310-717(+)
MRKKKMQALIGLHGVGWMIALRCAERRVLGTKRRPRKAKLHDVASLYPRRWVVLSMDLSPCPLLLGQEPNPPSPPLGWKRKRRRTRGDLYLQQHGREGEGWGVPPLGQPEDVRSRPLGQPGDVKSRSVELNYPRG